MKQTNPFERSLHDLDDLHARLLTEDDELNLFAEFRRILERLYSSTIKMKK
tara:strand:+ start:76 stop:228 length:153 start_codon:yes stop_codon:yes gene_type:complete